MSLVRSQYVLPNLSVIRIAAIAGDCKSLPPTRYGGSSPSWRTKYGSLAQLVEHLIEDHGVGGSNPLGSTKLQSYHSEDRAHGEQPVLKTGPLQRCGDGSIPLSSSNLGRLVKWYDSTLLMCKVETPRRFDSFIYRQYQIVSII